MASLFFSPKPLAHLCSELLHLAVVAETGGSVCSLIPLDIHELLTFLLYLCFVAGLLPVFLERSTTPGGVSTGASGGREASAEEGALPLSEGNMAVAPTARKTIFAFSCGLMLMLGMLTFWVLVRQDPCLLAFFMCLMAGLMLLVLLLASAKHRFNLGVFLVMLSSSGLIHLFVPGNDGFVYPSPAGFGLSPFLLFLGLMGTLLLVSLGVSFSPGDIVSSYSRGRPGLFVKSPAVTESASRE